MSAFEHVKPNEESVDMMDKLRVAFRELDDLLSILRPCRERALAITKLEEAAMWANKGVVFTQDATTANTDTQ